MRKGRRLALVGVGYNVSSCVELCVNETNVYIVTGSVCFSRQLVSRPLSLFSLHFPKTLPFMIVYVVSLADVKLADAKLVFSPPSELPSGTNCL